MLNFLFPRLTAERERGVKLFDAITAIARAPHWYVEGGVPDTIDGRFAVLATVCALVLVRIEREGEAGNPASVALTERFIAVMEAEHRELGLGDPALGRTVRRLVAALARRVGLWRSAAGPGGDWLAATRSSLYAREAATGSVEHSARALRGLFEGLGRRTLAEIVEGTLQ